MSTKLMRATVSEPGKPHRRPPAATRAYALTQRAREKEGRRRGSEQQARSSKRENRERKREKAREKINISTVVTQLRALISEGFALSRQQSSSPEGGAAPSPRGVELPGGPSAGGLVKS